MKTRLTYCLIGTLLLALLPLTMSAQEDGMKQNVSMLDKDPGSEVARTETALADSLGHLNANAEPRAVQASDLSVPESLPVCYENRGLANPNNRFIPKGIVLVGATATWSHHSHDNYSFLVVENIYSEGYTFKFRPYVGYAFTNNLVAGIRFGYSRTNLSVDNLSVSIGDEETGTHITITDYQLLRHTYAGELFGRYSIPLGQSKRLAILMELELGLAGSQARYAQGQPVKGTYETGTNFYVGVNPGLTVFLSNKFAVEATVGLFRFNYSSINQVHNQVDEGSVSSVSARMKINILDISLGLSFYL